MTSWVPMSATELLVVGREDCPKCDVLKGVLSDRGISFRYEQEADPEKRKARLKEVGSDTFPLVFHGDKYLGNSAFAVWLMMAFDEDDEPELQEVVDAWASRAHTK